MRAVFCVLVTGSLVRAVEARLDHKPEAVDQALKEGYILAPYFNEALAKFEKEEQSMVLYYTTMVQAIKAHKSNYALCTLEYECAVLLRKEAALHGVTNQVKVWDCDACYDKKFLQAGGADVEH